MKKYGVIALYRVEENGEKEIVNICAYRVGNKYTRDRIIQYMRDIIMRAMGNNCNIFHINEPHNGQENIVDLFYTNYNGRTVYTCMEYFPEYINAKPYDKKVLPWRNDYHSGDMAIKRILYANLFSNRTIDWRLAYQIDTNIPSIGRGLRSTIKHGDIDLANFLRERQLTDSILKINNRHLFNDDKDISSELSLVCSLCHYRQVNGLGVMEFESTHKFIRIPLVCYYKQGGEEACGET